MIDLKTSVWENKQIIKSTKRRIFSIYKLCDKQCEIDYEKARCVKRKKVQSIFICVGNKLWSEIGQYKLCVYIEECASVRYCI